MINCLKKIRSALAPVILLVLTTGCCWLGTSMSSSNWSSSSGDWTFKSNSKSGVVVSSDLTFKGKALPSTLLDKGATIITPLGTFTTSAEGRWENATPGQLSLGSPTETDAHKISPEELSQGFYETSNRNYGPAKPWTAIQLADTPDSWVYVFVESEKGYQGFWVDPQRIEDLPWE